VHYQDALAAFRAVGDTASAIDAANGLGLIRLAQRDFDEAFRMFSDAAGQAQDIGHHRLAAVISVNQAITLLEQGRPDQAAGAAEQALAGLAESGYQGTMFGEAYRVIVRACTELGRFEQAGQQVHTAGQPTAAEGADLAIRVLLLIDHANLALATGRPGLASDLLWQAENLGRPLGDPKIQAMVLSSLGQALHVQGRSSEAIDLHRRAVALRRRLPDTFLLAEALSRLADALAGAGDLDEATVARTEATGLLSGFSDPRAVALRNRLAGQAPDSDR
jgi:tetratricopeptide (TPR) repeat protein